MPGYADDADPRYVYTFWTADGSCLYVGCTVDFARRLATHRREREWFGDVARFEVTVHPDFASGIAAEAERIRTLQPVHNRALTGHDTPRRLPCRKCRAGRHKACVAINRDGDPCPCGTCVRIAA